MKKIYLTFDIETIMSRSGRSNEFYSSVFLGAIYIAEELKKRKLKGTFFISLSAKTFSINYNDYHNMVRSLISILKHYDNIVLAPHMHATNLPVGFQCKSDRFSDYNYSQQVELLDFAKTVFNDFDLKCEIFRPGGFLANSSYYKALSDSGFKYSSVLIKEVDPVLNLISKEINTNDIFLANNDIVEYPLTSVLVNSVFLRKEILNLSPDFFTLDSIKSAFEKLDYICVNFHSFSVFQNRFLRENHNHQFRNNLLFMAFEKHINKFLEHRSISTINDKTLTKIELSKWLDYISENELTTCFIGE